jgi:hypothetical protein
MVHLLRKDHFLLKAPSLKPYTGRRVIVTCSNRDFWEGGGKVEGRQGTHCFFCQWSYKKAILACVTIAGSIAKHRFYQLGIELREQPRFAKATMETDS